MYQSDLDRHLHGLQDELLVLGSRVQKAILRALDTLKSRDLEVSRQVMIDDDEIDRERFHLEEQCIELIATQQPVAKDLRRLVSFLHIAGELERVGDYAEGIAKISVRMGNEPPLKPLIDIPRMGDKAVEMLVRSLDALVQGDVESAEDVCRSDEEVDGI